MIEDEAAAASTTTARGETKAQSLMMICLM